MMMIMDDWRLTLSRTVVFVMCSPARCRNFSPTWHQGRPLRSWTLGPATASTGRGPRWRRGWQRQGPGPGTGSCCRTFLKAAASVVRAGNITSVNLQHTPHTPAFLTSLATTLTINYRVGNSLLQSSSLLTQVSHYISFTETSIRAYPASILAHLARLWGQSRISFVIRCPWHESFWK